MKTANKLSAMAATTDDPQQLLHDVAHCWAHIVGLLDGIQSTVDAIAEEAARPESPLHHATNAEAWSHLSGMIQDCGAVNCSVTFKPAIPDPLRSLVAGKRGAK